MSRNSNLVSNTSLKKIQKCLNNLSDYIEAKQFEDFSEQFNNIILKDIKMIKDCSEKSIVDFYVETAESLIIDDCSYNFNNEWWENLKSKVRHKLVDKYVSKELFDNTIDIYFNEVKREYILHPQGESEELEFIPENRDIFIKNNLKLVIECAKRYQNLGFPLEDLIQAGNIGLLIAFDKFDTERANLRISILNDITNHKTENFSLEDAQQIIRNNFKYSKLLDLTLNKLPKEGFENKKDFTNWANLNIKKASFSSIGFAWIRATIISELNKLSKIVRVPKSTNPENNLPLSIIRLDSINPHTDDNYHDNQTSEITYDEFIIEDEAMDNIEKNNLFKELVEKLLIKLPPLERRLVKKRYGIDTPFPISINEIAENENMSANKVKYAISNALKIITNNIPEEDKKTISEMLR